MLYTVRKALSSAFQIKAHPCAASAHCASIGELTVLSSRSFQPFAMHKIDQIRVNFSDLRSWFESGCYIVGPEFGAISQYV